MGQCKWCGKPMGGIEGPGFVFGAGGVIGYCGPKCETEAEASRRRPTSTPAPPASSPRTRAAPTPQPVQIVQCTGCGARCRGDSDFCVGCGAPIPKPMKCVKCKEINIAGARFCRRCGKGMEDAVPAVDLDAIGCLGLLAATLVGFMASGFLLVAIDPRIESPGIKLVLLIACWIGVGKLVAAMIRHDHRKKRQG